MSLSKDFKKAREQRKDRIVVNRNVMIETTINNLNSRIEYIKTTISKRVGEIEKRKQLNRKDLNKIASMEFRIKDLEADK